MNKQYARTDYEGCNYITAGKLYPIHWRGCRFFKIISDNGNVISPHFKNSIHIDDNDWEIIEVEESETMNVLTAKQAQQTAVMDWAEEMRARGWWVDMETRSSCEYVMASCGNLSTTHELEARGCDMVTALIELMKGWDAIYGEASVSVLDREWKAFVSGLPDEDILYGFAEDGSHIVFIKSQNGYQKLNFTSSSEAESKRGAMKAWMAINE